VGNTFPLPAQAIKISQHNNIQPIKRLQKNHIQAEQWLNSINTTLKTNRKQTQNKKTEKRTNQHPSTRRGRDQLHKPRQEMDHKH
jgi:hypothetical protein